MRSLLPSIARIAAALAVVAVVIAVAFAGWLGWQDHQYAKRLSATLGPVYALNEREYAKVTSSIPTYLCEKRAGMPVTEALTRIMHATDATWVATATRSNESIRRVEAPERWSDFHALVEIRREALVDLATATNAANARAVEVASSAQPRTEDGVVNALAADPRYRDLLDESRGAFLQVQDLEKKVRRATPDHYLSDEAISRELKRTDWEGTLPLGKLLENATRFDRPDTQSSVGATVASSPTAQVTPASPSSTCP
jgi:hypothetical protein